MYVTLKRVYKSLPVPTGSYCMHTEDKVKCANLQYDNSNRPICGFFQGKVLGENSIHMYTSIGKPQQCINEVIKQHFINYMVVHKEGDQIVPICMGKELHYGTLEEAIKLKDFVQNMYPEHSWFVYPLDQGAALV